MTKDAFDGFITPDGERISIDDAGRLIPMAEARIKEQKELLGFLLSIARRCFERELFVGAQVYFEKIYDLSDVNDVKAFCLLSIGQMKEKQRDYESALGWYRKAFSLGPGGGEVWYLLNNNLGYCLNYFERHKEALEYCRAAISLEPNRYNAHKNLGIALEGLGRHVEAAKSYLVACKLNPGDPRAMEHLEALLASHPEIMSEIPDLPEQKEKCRKGGPVTWQ